jgi:hypothetical protein
MNSFNKRGGNANSQKKKALKNEILSQMMKYTQDVVCFYDNYDPKKEFIIAQYLLYIPQDIFYTKKNDISSRKIDIDNFSKLFQDSIFNLIGINDKYALDNILSERPSNKWELKIYLTKGYRDTLTVYNN